MKRKLLPLLIAGLTVGAAGTALAGAPTIYGKANVTVHKNDFQSVTGGAAVDSQDNWSMESNASRLGVKGDFDVADGLKAIYKLEYEIFVDDGINGSSGSDEFNARNIYAGLQGGWGTVIAGRNDTPLKLSQGEVDRFNDLALADIGNVMVGENRADNMIMYSTPMMSGFNFTVGLVQGEDSGVTDAEDDDGLTDSISAAASYTNKMVYLALAVDDNVNENTDIIRAVGEVTFGPAKIGAIYQQAEASDNEDIITSVKADLSAFDAVLPGAGIAGYDEQDAYILNGEVKLGGPWKLKGQYGFSESSTAQGFDDAEVTLMALGVDYKLNDNAKIFAYYAQLETEGDASFTSDTVEDKTFAVGFDFKF